MKKIIEIVPYDPNWPNAFEQEAECIRQALGDKCLSIYHIGSTSVQGLDGKNSIDILCVIDELKSSLKLQDSGYIFKGEFNIPLRYFFSKNTEKIKVNVHIVEKDHAFIDLQLRFRNYLRSNEEEREKYAQLKYNILQDPASSFRKPENFNIPNYTIQKNQFIKNILELANFKKFIANFCLVEAEWESAKQFRNKYFFEPNKIEDPYTWTFDHKDHKHFILYKGVNIVGYAHVQLWPENRAALRIIVIDKKEQGKGYGKEFMSLIEKWLRLEGYKSIHTESSPEALKFYQSINYVKMPFDDPDGYEGDPSDTPMGKLL